MIHRLQFRFPASTEYLQPLQELAQKLLEIWVPDHAHSSEAGELLLAVQEAVTNVMRHGYEGKGGDIVVEFRVDREEVVFEICDWGKSFDPQKVPNPDFDRPTPGGYGVFIMKNVTDRLEYRREGEMNIAHLMKRFQK